LNKTLFSFTARRDKVRGYHFSSDTESLMLDLSRREALAATALAGMVAAMPAWAQDAGVGGAQWDLTDLYPSDAAWDEARKKALADVPSMTKYKGKLGESADTLAAFMVAQSDLGRTIGRIYTYASLKADADLRVSANQEKQAQAIDVYTAFGEATSWVSPELLTVGKVKIDQFVAANATLKKRFDFSLADTLRQVDHTLSPESEKLLAGVGSPFSGFSDIREQLVASDIPWPTITLSTGKQVRLDDQAYTLTRDAPNRADRKLVFDTFWTEYGKFQNSLGAAYLSHVKADIFRKKARKYPTSLAAALSGNNIPEGVYRTLVAETGKGLPELHRYFELRRKLLGLSDMAYYDIYPPLVALDKKVTVPEMRTTTSEAVKPLGPEYAEIFAKATAGKWMDPLPRPGKKSGAYMNPGAAYDVHPYLLLNLGENYEGMTTYAHEWGHAMHTLLAKKYQVYEKYDYSIFTAEIASTCNEQLLAAYMVANARTKQEKLFYLGQQLEGIRGTYYRQTMFAEFELAVHDKAEAGEGLSGEKFSSMYLDLLKRYHGPKVAVSDTYASEWAYIPHFYNSFYVYQYATCISAASYFARSILKGGAKERDNYLSVLKAGGSDFPYEVLKRAGLDMASPAPYQAIIQTFRETLDQCEKLMA
jgi:oligoendopeptidase F